MIAAAACTRGAVRLLPDRLDHHRIDLPLRDRRRDRAVPGHEGIDRVAFVGQAAAAHPDRLLLRRVPRGDRRRRCSGRDRGIVPDRTGIRPVPGGDALPGREHGARGLGRRRQPDPRAGRRDRLARDGLECHDGPDPSSVVGDPAALAGAEHGRLARDAGGLAGPGRQRPLVRPDAVLLVELPGVGPGRRRRRPGLAAGDGRVPARSGSPRRSWPTIRHGIERSDRAGAALALARC